MTVWRNGEQMGTDSLASTAWSFEQMLVYASRGAMLVPGDVIGSGTCGGGCLGELWGRAARVIARRHGPGDEVTMRCRGSGGSPIGSWPAPSRSTPASHAAVAEPVDVHGHAIVPAAMALAGPEPAARRPGACDPRAGDPGRAGGDDRAHRPDAGQDRQRRRRRSTPWGSTCRSLALARALLPVGVAGAGRADRQGHQRGDRRALRGVRPAARAGLRAAADRRPRCSTRWTWGCTGWRSPRSSRGSICPRRRWRGSGRAEEFGALVFIPRGAVHARRAPERQLHDQPRRPARGAHRRAVAHH